MSLRRRVLLATLSVALVAVVVTALAALQLVRSADTAATRDQLAVQAERLASAPRATRTAIIEGLSGLTDGQLLVAQIGPAGEVAGSAAGIVPKRVLVAVAAGRDASTTVRSGGQTYLLEARATDAGGVVLAQPADRVLGIGSAVWPRLLLALGIGLLVAVVAAVLLSRLLARPLTRLATAARRLAAGERDVPVARSDLAEVADVEAALIALDAALARSEGRQREFLLSISHELRTPLTAIRGYAEALADGVVAPAETADVGRTLVSESDRLTAFTSDLLALARLEADDFPLDITTVDLRDVVSSALAVWAATADAGGVRLTPELPQHPVRVRADAARVRQVVDGLLENALRVSPRGSEIRVAVGASAGDAALAVADGGPGLTPDDAARAFERGLLHERYRGARPVGTGLGLSIAARLVERMGGRISAHSAVGSGAEFRIRLPLAED
ncbi:MAG TPA: HAMP domain-containing sensor histidine kinase [Pseudolysinimonas sp.]|jgi:two-component system sensor histidine kinase BaeS|nr:HAMP domain-containing sensor histidine kinase [Pseudolysinimonas sp.]